MAENKILKKILEKQNKIEEETREILKDEEKILKEILKEEKDIREEEVVIKDEEQIIREEEEQIQATEEQIERLIKTKVVTRKFDDIVEWKSNIWDNCQYKKKIEKDNELSYSCVKLNKNCNFSGCPLNYR